jgi:hypothetical protein
MKKLLLPLAYAFSMLFIFSSCLTTKTQVGTHPTEVGNEYTYAKGKQLWLFWGLLPLGRNNVNTPPDGSCEVVTRFNFSDVLISTLTGGILTSYTIKIKDKRPGITPTN